MQRIREKSSTEKAALLLEQLLEILRQQSASNGKYYCSNCYGQIFLQKNNIK